MLDLISILDMTALYPFVDDGLSDTRIYDERLNMLLPFNVTLPTISCELLLYIVFICFIPFLFYPRPEYSINVRIIFFDQFKQIVHDGFVLLAHFICWTITYHVALFG